MKEFLELQKDEVSKECRFAVYIPAREPGGPDMHFVKENVLLKNGQYVPRVRKIYNYQRPYWVVKKGFRNYKQPKEWIHKDKVNMFYSTESDLIYKAARSLGKPYFKGSLKDLCQDPYLFGVDIKSTCLIKKDYQDTFDQKTKFSYGVFDVETDVVNGTEEIIMASFTMESICFTAVQKSFLKGIALAEEKIKDKTNELLKEYVEKRGIQSELKIVDSEIDCVIECFKVIHKAKPDWLAIWNIKFDVTKIIEACDRADYPIENIVSDPSVEPQFKYFRFKQGPTRKKKASGDEVPIPASLQWHTVICPSSFYFIDAMSAYRQTRMGEQEKKNYNLDTILGLELNLSKLKFEQANDYIGIAWHQFMQKNYPVEYVVYNRFDCIAMELLEEKSKDCSVVLPQFAHTSDFSDFNKQPRRKMDALHWFVQTLDHVVGCTSESLVDETDSKVLNKEGWIVTLAPSLTDELGLKCIEENPNLVTTIYSHCGDLDVSASYPNGEICFNISKETTVNEIISIENIPEGVFRKQNMGLSSGQVNSVDYCTTMLGMPSLFELEKLWDLSNSVQEQK